VTLDVSINLNSLKVIEDQLNETIAHSATCFEAYISDRSNTEQIDECRASISQVGGIFRLLEYPGAALLADEMASLVAAIASHEQKNADTMIAALTHAYFVLPRYIEFIAVRKKEMPTLVIPYANELRVSRRQPLLPEFHFYKQEIPLIGLLPQQQTASNIPLLLASASRLRHMYQTGLVGVISDPDSMAHYLFLSRSLSRFVSLVGDHPQAELWQLANLVVDAFAAGKLELTLNRKRNLAEIEKLMRAVVSKGEEGLSQSSTSQFKRELLFMLMLTNYSHKDLDAVREAYSLPTLTVTDADLVKERGAMHGPSIETIESVIKVLSEELRSAKDILELGSQNNEIDIDDLLLLKSIVSRVADTLSILNLHGPKATLLEQLEKIEGWTESVDPGRAEFQLAADTLLYIDSALSGLDRRELTVEDLNEATSLTRKKIIAGSQLAQAEQIVLQEAQSGIALAKRAITSYVESNFDRAHIANVGVTLNSVRGGMHILNYDRAAAILKHCGEFVAHHITDPSAADQRHQLLETLADALISLEYYLTELGGSRTVNQHILDVAEESLQTLGFAVSGNK
jgi:hypothetical protein